MAKEDELTPEETAALQEMEAEAAEGTPQDAESTEDTSPALEAEAALETQDAETQREDDVQAEQKAAKPPPGYVPHQAMEAERQERKKLQMQLEELRAQIAPPETEAAPEYVDPLVDPEGHRKWTEHQVNETRKMLEQQQERMQQAETIARRQQEFAAAESDFSAKTPDYAEAVQHLRQSRVDQLAAMGHDEATINQQLSKDVNAIFDAAKMIGMNPAELAYIRARDAGYTPKSAATPAPDEAAKMAAQANAQKQTQSMGAGGGTAQSGGLTAETLANMSQKEFDRVMRERPDEVAKAVGAA